jgi:small conductance mechanosensitive channel
MNEQIVSYGESLQTWAEAHVVRMLVILIAAWVANKVFRFLLRRFTDWFKGRYGDSRELAVRIDTLASVLRFTWLTALIVVVTAMELGELGLAVAPLVGAAGIVGLAVGFGAQSLVKDVITGFFLLLENHYGVGDVVNIAGTGGLVEAMNLRFTTLRDVHGTVHSVPHGEVTTVSNLTRDWSRMVVDLGVDFEAPPDRVIEVLKDECKRFHEDAEFGPQLIEEPEVPGIEELGDSAVVYRVMGKTLPTKQWGAMRELRRRLLIRLQQEEISIPFPQQTLSFREKDTLVAALAARAGN